MPIYGIPCTAVFYLSTVCIVDVNYNKNKSAIHVIRSKSQCLAVMWYTLVTFIQIDDIECGMKKCKSICCFYWLYKIMYSTSFVGYPVGTG